MEDTMKYERCNSDNRERFDAVTICEARLLLILREWRIRRREFGELMA
jgi:hypothetical protein